MNENTATAPTALVDSGIEGFGDVLRGGLAVDRLYLISPSRWIPGIWSKSSPGFTRIRTTLIGFEPERDLGDSR